MRICMVSIICLIATLPGVAIGKCGQGSITYTRGSIMLVSDPYEDDELVWQDRNDFSAAKASWEDGNESDFTATKGLIFKCDNNACPHNSWLILNKSTHKDRLYPSTAVYHCVNMGGNKWRRSEPKHCSELWGGNTPPSGWKDITSQVYNYVHPSGSKFYEKQGEYPYYKENATLCVVSASGPSNCKEEYVDCTPALTAGGAKVCHRKCNTKGNASIMVVTCLDTHTPEDPNPGWRTIDGKPVYERCAPKQNPPSDPSDPVPPQLIADDLFDNSTICPKAVCWHR